MSSRERNQKKTLIGSNRAGVRQREVLFSFGVDDRSLKKAFIDQNEGKQCPCLHGYANVSSVFVLRCFFFFGGGGGVAT